MWIVSKCEKFEKFLSCSRNISNLENAFIKIMDEVAVQHVLTLIKPDRQKYAMMDFKESFLTNRQDSEGIIFRQETTSGINTIPEQRKRQLAAIIIDEFDEFLDVYVKISPKIFKLNGVYVIVLLKGEIPEIERIFELLRKIQVFKVIVMFDNGNDSVLLKSFRPFEPDNCDNTTPYVIDEFKEGGFVNSSRLVFQNTMKNLHKCPVRASIATTVEPYVIVKKLSNNSYDLRGQDIKMLNALSESLNFTVNYTYIGPEGYFFENGTVEGPLRTILDDEADLSASAWWLKSHRMKTLEATTSYISEKVIFIIPPGRELSTFEKLIFPFSTPLWLLTLLVFLVGYSVIFIINHCSMTIRHFVFGRNVGNSYINMFIGFIGGSQHILPGRNFARFLLVMFLKYSLVMRTVYQGRFYQLLKSNVRIEEIQSIDEMIEKDFKFYLYTAYADNFMGTEAIRERFG